MPIRRHNYPDYFGSRSIEPVGGGRRHREEQPETTLEPEPEPYAVQPARRAYQPNQWASSGRVQAPARSARTSARGLDNLQKFAYGGATTAAVTSTAARPQSVVRSQISNTFGQVKATTTPRRPPARPPPTPWSNQPGVRINWSRRPDGGYYGAGSEMHRAVEVEEEEEEEEEEGEGYGVSVQPPAMPSKSFGGRRLAVGGAVQPPRRDPYELPLPPTPCTTSSTSPATRSLIRPVHRAAPRVNGIDLVSPRTALDARFHGIFPYEHFNAMQSSCFACVHGSNDNVVVAAPTGSGKTVIFELAICRLLAQRDREHTDVKIVYQAPTKALCSERARDWQAKFGKGAVAEFTGDSSAFEVRRVRTASIIVTTPEKWDSITRKWSSHTDHANSALLRSVKLVLIDEVHVLKDAPRGATLETVVSRMKTLGSDVRFVALSATIPNAGDIAQWLGLTHTTPQLPARTYVFGTEFRPVRVQNIVLGFNVGGGGGGGGGGMGNGGSGSSEHTLDNMLDEKIPDLIVKHAQGKPVLIFCFSRKSTESAATALVEFWSQCAPHQRPWPAPTVEMRATAAKLQTAVSAGVAFHHGGLERRDREMIEDAFLKGHIHVICCTSTLAVGVNLPCHTVILKGTMGYQGGKFAEYDEFEVMQMIGRAGRPQFDTSATAIILTRTENRDKYLHLESGRQAVESTLHLNLIEHLNSEIVLGTISSLATAIRWLEGTFLAVRLRQNSHYYQLTDAATSVVRTTEEQLEEICKVGIARLAEVGLIEYADSNGDSSAEPTSDSVFRGTAYGSAMSTYMVRFETMVQIVGFDKRMTLEQLLNALCHAAEFDDLRIKSTERPVLRELNMAEANNIPFAFKKESITETWQKVSLLLQVELSRGTLPHQHGRFTFEARRAMEHMQRLLECFLLCTIDDGNGHNTRIALELARSVAARAWEGDGNGNGSGGHHPAQLCQVPDIGPVNMRKLADKNVTTVRQLAALGPVAIERLLSKNPAAAMKMADTLKEFPLLAMEGQVSRCVGGGSSSSKAVAQVTVRFANENGVPRWRGRVPTLSFVAETAAGQLLHIWRGRLQANRQEHDMSFAVPLEDAEAVNCYVACDEIAGTLTGAQLSCVDVAAAEIKAISRGVKPLRPAKVKTVQEGEPPAKRQKVQHVDLCGSTRALPALRDDSFAFSNTAVSNNTAAAARQPKHCSGGGGTQNNPFTLDSGSDSDSDLDLDSDDFDTDIFDDLELPAVEASSAAKPVADDDKGKKGGSTERTPTAVDDKGKKREATERPRTSDEDKENRRQHSPLTVKDLVPLLQKEKQQPAKVGPTPPTAAGARQTFSMPSVFQSIYWDSSSDEEEDAMDAIDKTSTHGKPEKTVEPESIEPAVEARDAEPMAVPTAETTTEPAVEDAGGSQEEASTSICSFLGDVPKGDTQPTQPTQPPQPDATPNEPGWVRAAANSSVIDFLRGHVKFV